MCVCVFQSGERDFPGGPVVKTLCFHCQGPWFSPWSENQDPTCHMAWPKIRSREGEINLHKNSPQFVRYDAGSKA